MPYKSICREFKRMRHPVFSLRSVVKTSKFPFQFSASLSTYKTYFIVPRIQKLTHMSFAVLVETSLLFMPYRTCLSAILRCLYNQPMPFHCPKTALLTASGPRRPRGKNTVLCSCKWDEKFEWNIPNRSQGQLSRLKTQKSHFWLQENVGMFMISYHFSCIRVHWSDPSKLHTWVLCMMVNSTFWQQTIFSLHKIQIFRDTD